MISKTRAAALAGGVALAATGPLHARGVETIGIKSVSCFDAEYFDSNVHDYHGNPNVRVFDINNDGYDDMVMPNPEAPGVLMFLSYEDGGPHRHAYEIVEVPSTIPLGDAFSTGARSRL